jgi:hypothetical protein
MDLWFKPLIWLDYRLAVFFTLSFPLVLSVWAIVKKVDVVSRLLIIYWRVSSLLLISIYLMIPSWSIGFLAGLGARILIPISLWFWIDLNEELSEMPDRPLKLVVKAWRWAVTIYCLIGAIGSIPSLSCAFSQGAIESDFCQVYLEAPWLYQQTFHSDSSPAFLGFLGLVGLVAYITYFIYFVLVRFGKQGRSAIEQ